MSAASNRQQKSTYTKDLETVMIYSGIRSELPLLHPILQLIPLPSIRHMLGSMARLKSYGSAAIARSKALSEKGETGKTLFFKMLASTDESSDSLKDDEIEREATNLIIAGSDTTSVTLTYLIWAVLKHPLVLLKLQEEVRSLPQSFSANQVLELPYLAMVIKETLRLYGAAPGSLPRVVPKGGRSLAGFMIPEGSVVSTQAYTLHRNPVIFQDPLSFKPERWMETSQEMKQAFMPWGGGSRGV